MWRFYIFLNVLTFKIIKSKIKDKDILVSTKQQTKWNGSQQTSYHYLLDCTRKTLETLHSNFPSPAQQLQQFNTTHQNTHKFPRPNQPYPWFHSIWFSCVSNSKPFFHSFPNAFRHWNSLASFPYIWKSKYLLQ